MSEHDAERIARELQAAVDLAMVEYVEDDPVPPGHCVAIRCHDKADAKYNLKAIRGLFFKAEKLKHDGTWYVYITDLRGSDPDDAVFEIGWYGVDVGWIPDPRTPKAEDLMVPLHPDTESEEK